MTMRSTFPGANSSMLNFTRTISAAVIAITCACSSYTSAQNKEPDWVNTKPSQGQNSGGEPKMQMKWKVQPFDKKVFIENKYFHGERLCPDSWYKNYLTTKKGDDTYWTIEPISEGRVALRMT